MISERRQKVVRNRISENNVPFLQMPEFTEGM